MNSTRHPAAAMLVVLASIASAASAADAAKPAPAAERWKVLAPHFEPPAEYAGKLGDFRSPLLFEDGSPVRTRDDWPRRRQEILAHWHRVMGAWPPVIEKPQVEYLEAAQRDGFTQHKVRVEVAKGQMSAGYLLVPPGDGPFPAAFVPFYEPQTSTGQTGDPKKQLRDFAYQLTKRGFVTLSIGSPGGDARLPDTAGQLLQPLSYLAYVAANGYQALASLPYVDPKRVGVVGHSYGGKWAMFASCLYDKYAAAAWSDGGIVWDEKRSNVNYWEPWYLGLDPHAKRPRRGVIAPDNPRTGAYKTLVETNRDPHELHALMAPRPFLVSGGSEDPPERWMPLNHAVAVNKLLGHTHRVGMTNRPAHGPTEASNDVIYRFFEHVLK